MVDTILFTNPSKTTSIEEQQIFNLYNNWALRKDLSEKIGCQNGYDVFVWKDRFGRVVFYIVREGTPVGYIACHLDLDGVSVYITSTFLVPVVRRRGLAKMAYLIILHQGYDLYSDNDRSAGGEALWKSLMKEPSITVKTLETRYRAWSN